FDQLASAAGSPLPKSCTLTPDLTFDGGALDVDAGSGSIRVEVAAALKALGLDLNALPPNSDLMHDVLRYLSSPSGLAKGLQAVVTGLTDPLQHALSDCVPSGTVGDLLTRLTDI